MAAIPKTHSNARPPITPPMIAPVLLGLPLLAEEAAAGDEDPGDVEEVVVCVEEPGLG